MRQLRQTRYTQSKHRHSYPFHPGNVITVPEETPRMPAYNTSGKEYRRKLLPMRDQRVINISLLCTLLTQLVPHNQIKCIGHGIIINKNEVIISEGMATINSKLKFRFSDVRELMKNLVQEQVLIANLLDLQTIKYNYFRKLNST